MTAISIKKASIACILYHCIFLSIFFLGKTASIAQDRLSGRMFNSRSEVIAKNGMVATSHPIATQIGIEVLKKGGSAVDAAIAANAFLGFADPGMCGLGGDLFAIIWDPATEKLHGLNASGRSPLKLPFDYFSSNHYKQVPFTGPLSLSVPGCVDGWFEMHGKFGKLAMSEILSPAANYAAEGVPVTAETADFMQWFFNEHQTDLAQNPTFQKYYMKDGEFPKKGGDFKNPDLAKVLEKIGKEGRDAFYKGEIADKIIEHVQKAEGYLAKEDFEAHTSTWVEPVSTNYRGFEVWEIPPNGQGMSVLQMLNILEGFDLAAHGFGSKEHIHYFTEAKKLAYEDMAKYYGDMETNEVPVEKLLSKSYADERRELINPEKAGIFQPGPESGSHTVYLTVADKNGMMVSLIQSNAALFGSREVPDGLGFVLQNRGASFELDAQHINGYAPGKRPFHTIIPAFVTKEGQPFMSFGVMGGDMQPQGHVQVLINMIDFGMDLQEAGDAPRINHAGSFPVRGHVDNPGTIHLESGFSYETIRDLMRMGHDIKYIYGNYGGYQAIMFNGETYFGASDPRKDGQAAGY